MYQIFIKNWDKWKYLILSGIFILLMLLLTVVYKSDQKVVKKSNAIEISYDNQDFQTLKKYLLDQIRSPYINLNYPKSNP